MAANGVAEDFNLHQNSYKPIPLDNPYCWMNEDGDTLLLHSSFEKTVEEIRYFSQKDAQTYRAIRATIDFMMEAMTKLGTKHPAQPGKLDIASLLLAAALALPGSVMFTELAYSAHKAV